MKSLKFSSWSKQLLSLVLFLGLIVNAKSAEVIPRFVPKNIPLLQGKYTKVGEIQLDSAEYDQVRQVMITLEFSHQLDGIRIMGQSGKSEPIVLAENKSPSASENLVLQNDLPTALDKIWVEIQPQQQHDLLDKIQVKVPEIILGTENVKLHQEVEATTFRIAHELRNYGMDGVHSFRIPGLVTTPKGTLLAVYDIRRNSSVDMQGDIDVGISRSTDQGRTWSDMHTIIDMGTYAGLPQDQNGVGDPAILVDPVTGHIWVIALWAHGKPGKMIWNTSQPGLSPAETGQLVLVKSEDDGLTWSEPRNITSQMKNPEWNLFFNGPGKGIVMKDGTLVFPAQYKDADAMPYSTIIYSKDKGNTWQVGTGAKSNTTEAQVVELQDGSLMLNMRDNRGGSRSIAVTEDLGQNWVEHSTSRNALPEPICMASLIDNPFEGGMLLFSNPATVEGRSNITIKASLDDGQSWNSSQQVLLDEGTGWGYSCLTMINKKEVGILYESSVSNITFQIVPLKEILK